VLASLGLILPKAEKKIAPDEIKKLAEERWQARENRDWEASDRLRDELLEKGWVVKDGREGYELVSA
jgi:cysteinyl-tRNA synthetase